MNFQKKIVRVLAVLLFSLLASTLNAQSVRVPGTKVSLAPPPGFVNAELFPGFQHNESGSSIMITEIPAPISEILVGMTKENLATQGVELISKADLTFPGCSGVELHAAQVSAGIEFQKWMIVVGNDKECLLLVGTFPKMASPEIGAAIRESIRGMTWTPERETDLFEGLEFRVTPTKRLKLAGRMTNMVMLTGSGNQVTKSAAEPFMAVGNSYSDQKIEDLESFSEARSLQIPGLKNIQTLTGRKVKLAGLDAFELLLKATDEKSGKPMRVLQIVARAEDRYYLIQALIVAAKWKQVEPVFRKVIESFKLVPVESTAGK